MTAALQASGLGVRYGGIRAVSDVDLDVAAGEIVGLVGPNGAGKTTTIDALTGFTRCSGLIQLSGKEISRLSPKARADRGLTRTWQAAELFDELTVAENLAVAASRLSVRRTLREILTGVSPAEPEVGRTLELLGISELADLLPESLTYGQRKLVGIARALASRPTVICLDEPAAGLDTAESQLLGTRLKEVAEQGISILLVDHDMGLVLGICDQIVVLDFGQIISKGTPAQIVCDTAVIDAYLGSGTAAEEQALSLSVPTELNSGEQL